MIPTQNRRVYAAVLVAALGYFVDVYDLILFSVVRVQSLKSLGVPEADLLPVGLSLLNWQMGGMLAGGVLWGILGDKRGRLSVLFGSIFLYSAANFANGFVTSIPAYAALRFLSGLGLAGELGAGITLVSEMLPAATRGYSTTIIATVGVLGGAIGAAVGDALPWRTSYFVGGGLGLALLLLRVSVAESGMFAALRERAVARGSLRLLLGTRERAVRYLSCILVGLPTWYIVGVLITAAPEFGKSFGMTEIPSAGRAVMFTYFGLVVGDLASGALSQLLKSRRKTLGIFNAVTAVLAVVYLTLHGPSLATFYGVCFALGISVGSWAVFVTTAAEQFGTNLRATVATTVPNFVRGSVVPMTMCFAAMRSGLGLVGAASIVGLVALGLSLLALVLLEESFGRELDFVEGDEAAN